MKFKVWCKNNNEWEKHDVLMSQDRTLFHLKLGGALLPLNPDTHIPVFSTGKNDKNGVEIYNGSIVSDELGQCFKVIWNQEECQFVAEYRNDDEVFVLGNWCEIIGNIYENPELLKEG